MVSVQIETHGCKLNTADSQRMAAEFLRSGFEVWDGSVGEPDVFVLNSCTVTHVADKKARQAVRGARRRHPAALTVMAGCYPERAAEETAALSEVDLVVGNRDKDSIVSRVLARLQLEVTPCADGGAYGTDATLLGRTRASVKIQEGCDQVCAYCIVPKVRGRERSVPVSEIVAQVQELENAGCMEVVFTGTQLGHYGFDLGSDRDHCLSGMLQTVLGESGIPRIRVSSLQPQEIDEELLEIWVGDGEGRPCPHFHMPLQSGSDAILERMRRTYTASDFLSKVSLVRSAVPDVGLTTDVISGFPGEGDDDHRRSAEVMGEAAFSSVHVFPYSGRPGTSAYHFGEQVAPAVKAARAKELRAIGDATAAEFRVSQLGSVRPVLWEGNRGTGGLTDNYFRVRMRDAIGTRESVGDGLIEDVRLKALGEDGVLEVEAV